MEHQVRISLVAPTKHLQLRLFFEINFNLFFWLYILRDTRKLSWILFSLLADPIFKLPSLQVPEVVCSTLHKLSLIWIRDESWMGFKLMISVICLYLCIGDAELYLICSYVILRSGFWMQLQEKFELVEMERTTLLNSYHSWGLCLTR